MHILHKILVHLPSDVPADEGDSRGEYLERIRSYAEEETDEFYETAYDWRETESAGRWKDEYPENVILGSESEKRLLRELKETLDSQSQEIQSCTNSLIEGLGDQLSGIVSGIQKGSSPPIQGDHFAYLLKKLGKLLDGEYFYDSLFYDTTEYTAKINEATVAKVQEKPQDWALVLFDYHF